MFKVSLAKKRGEGEVSIGMKNFSYEYVEDFVERQTSHSSKSGLFDGNGNAERKRKNIINNIDEFYIGVIRRVLRSLYFIGEILDRS